MIDKKDTFLINSNLFQLLSMHAIISLSSCTKLLFVRQYKNFVTGSCYKRSIENNRIPSSNRGDVTKVKSSSFLSRDSRSDAFLLTKGKRNVFGTSGNDTNRYLMYVNDREILASILFSVIRASVLLFYQLSYF
jgi:hypothetical protein